MKLAEAIGRYVDHLRYVDGVSASSAALYEWHLRAFAKFTRARELDAAAERVEHYLVAIGRKGLADSTRVKAFGTLRAFYRWAFDKKLCASSPLRHSRTPKIRNVNRSWLSPDQVEALMRGAALRGGQHAERNAALIATIYYGCLRNTEARCALVEHLDLEAATLRVLRKGGQWQVVLLPGRLVQILRAWLANRPKDSPYLFPARARHATGCGVLDRSRVAEIVREARRWAGLEKGTPHSLRRSIATHLIRGSRPGGRKAKPAPLQVVQRRLDHKTALTTETYLEQVGLDGQRPWIEKW